MKSEAIELIKIGKIFIPKEQKIKVAVICSNQKAFEDFVEERGVDYKEYIRVSKKQDYCGRTFNEIAYGFGCYNLKDLNDIVTGIKSRTINL